MVDYKLELYSIIENIIKDQNNENIDWSPEAISAFTNLLTSHIKITAADMESFAKHAKRSTINQDDVKLLTRRNEKLEKEISEFISKNLKRE